MKTLRLLKDDEKSYPTSSLAEGVIEGYPFRESSPFVQMYYPLEQYYKEQLYTKPSAMVVLGDEEVEEQEPVDADGARNAVPSNIIPVAKKNSRMTQVIKVVQ